MQFEAKYGKVKSENDILALKLAESQERQKLEAEKFKALDGIIKAKIEEKSAQWNLMLAEKLKEKDIFEKPACKVFKNVIKTLNK